MTTVSSDQVYAVLSELIATAPAFEYRAPLTAEDQRWLAKAAVWIKIGGTTSDDVDFAVARNMLGTLHHNRDKLIDPLLRAFYFVEVTTSISVRNTFLPGGDAWGGYSAIVKLISDAKSSVMFVDPYLDASFLTDFVPILPNDCKARALASDRYKAALIAGLGRLEKDNREKANDLEVRLAPKESMHDRLIILDNEVIWLVSQSLKDVAKKSPASLTKADRELGSLKIAHYAALWDGSLQIN